MAPMCLVMSFLLMVPVDAGAVAERFLAHIDSIAPVAGTFRISSEFDKETQDDMRRKTAESYAERGVELHFKSDDPDVHCEWAWDGTAESLKSLDGSNRFEQFYRTPESLLLGMGEKNYNLKVSEIPDVYRPATFYLLKGSRPWASSLADFSFSLRAAPEGSPAGTVQLVGSNRDREILLLVDEQSGALHGYESKNGRETASHLTIDAWEESPDGR